MLFRHPSQYLKWTTGQVSKLLLYHNIVLNQIKFIVFSLKTVSPVVELIGIVTEV